VQTCPNCGEQNPARFRLCGFCGTSLAQAVPVHEVRKVVSIVFSDLQGSTALGERLDSESLREVMSRYFEEMQRVLEQHSGTVEKFIGDAVMAVFGLPKLHEDDALRAVRAAAEMQAALATLNEELEQRWGVRLTSRIGVNTGEVVAGDPRAGQRLVTGDAVNVAARLEQAAPAMGVLLGESTFRLVRDAVEAEPVEPLALKGKSEPVAAYRLMAVHAGEAPARRLDAPMVGRSSELAHLADAFDVAVSQRTVRLVLVVGTAGVGKSRLIQEFAASVETEGQVLRGRCLPYGEGITFWPLGEVVRQAAGITEEDSLDDARGRLATLLPDEDIEVAERIAAAIGLATTSFRLDDTFWATRKLFESLSRRRPTVVVFDDIHWAEPTFLELIENLVKSAWEVPIVLVCTSRPDLLEERPGWLAAEAAASRVELEPLNDDESALIVDNLLGRAGAAREVRARVIRAAEGNPLFVEQLLAMLIDDGRLRQEENGEWRAASDLTTLAIPPTIHALIAARLDQLLYDERDLLERAGVIGQTFYRGAVEELLEETSRDQLPTSLLALTHKQLIREDESTFQSEDAYRFRHILIRDAAYQGLLKRARADLHERFAEWLVRAAGSRVAEYEEIVGYHLEQSFRYRSELGPLDEAGRDLGARAAALLAGAGRRAFARGDMPAASNLIERATALLPADDLGRLELLPDLGEALLDLGEYAKADALVGEAIEGAKRLGDERLEADADLVRLLVRFGSDPEGWSEKVTREVERTIPVLEAVGDHAALSKAWRLLGSVHGTACRYEAAEQAVSHSIDQARLAGDSRQEVRNLGAYALSALYGPMPVEQAISRCEQILEQAPGDLRARGIVQCSLAHLQAMQGHFEEARSLYTEARRTFQELGGTILAASTSLDSGRVELLAGDPAAAERELRPDYLALEALGERYLRSTLAALLAHALYLQGRVEEADTFSRVTEETADGEDVESQALWRTVRAKVEARRGRHEEAAALAREAVALTRQTDGLVMQANALMDLAEVLVASGKQSEAAGAVDEALALYERKGDLVTLAKAIRFRDESIPTPLASSS
jgi:class 3 adenylate cyclase/tetratricopeptide (TPR) repeat protein